MKKRFHSGIVLAVLMLSGCNGGGGGSFATNNPPDAGSSTMPLGAEVFGATLSGPLAGKKMYLLPATVSPSHCWADSPSWTGSELFYGLSSISWTGLVANTPAYAADPDCQLPSSQIGSGFNIYSASYQSGSWNLTNLAFNTGAHPIAAPKIDSDEMVFVSYEKTASNLGNIYFIHRAGTNSWGSPVAFSLNSSSCNDDNPVLYSNQTKIIFESNRDDAAASSCTSNHQRLWISTYQSGVWSTPSLVLGAPAAQSFQPWVDESSGDLYWTGDSSACGGSVMNCVLRAGPQGTGWSNTAEKIVTPTALSSGSADGKVVLTGQYTQANGYAILACGIANDVDPSGNTDSLYQGRWSIDINICAIPLQ